MSICFPPDVSGHLLRQDGRGRWRYQLFALKDSFLSWFHPEAPIEKNSRPLGIECISNARVQPVDLKNGFPTTRDGWVRWGIAIKPACEIPGRASELDIILVADTSDLRDLWIKAMYQASVPRSQLLEMIVESQVRGGTSSGDFVNHMHVPLPPSSPEANEHYDGRMGNRLGQKVNEHNRDESCDEHMEPNSCLESLLSAIGCGTKQGRKASFVSNPSSRNSSFSKHHYHSQRQSYEAEQDQLSLGRESRVEIGHHRSINPSLAPLHPCPIGDDRTLAPRISVSSWCSKDSSPPQVHLQSQGESERCQERHDSLPLSFVSSFKAMSPPSAAAAITPKQVNCTPSPIFPPITEDAELGIRAIESQVNELRFTVSSIHKGLDSTQRLRQASVEAVDRKISSIQSMMELKRIKRQLSRGANVGSGGSTSSSSENVH